MQAPLPPPVATAIAAVNDGDTDTFVAAFSADGAVDDWGRVFEGHDGIRGWSDRELIGVEATLDVTGVAAADDGVAVVAQVGGHGFNGPSTFTFAVSGDAIERMTITA